MVYDRTYIQSLVLTIFFFGALYLTPVAKAALSCSITTAGACTGTVLLRMSASSNAHAELPSQSTAGYANNTVCCTGASLTTSCSGSYATVVRLASVTNSHVQQNNTGTYANSACIASVSGVPIIAYQQSSCVGYDTTLASLSASTNAQVGGGADYTTKVCGSFTATSLTFITDSSSQAFPAHTPGVLVATSSILTVNTNNTAGFIITVSRSDSVGTLALVADSSVYVPDKTSWSAPGATTTAGGATASTTEPSTLQFRIRAAGTDVPNYASSWWGANDTLAGALFAGLPATTQTISNRSTAAVASTTTYVVYNLNVPATQKTGSYSGAIIYTATGN